MKTVLRINSSARIERSHTRYLTDLFIREWQSLRPKDPIFSREIGIQPPVPVNQAWIAAAFTPSETRTPAMREILQLSDTLVDELVQANLIVLGAPMYNFGMPAQLKAYVDQIVRVGRTFAFDPSNKQQPYRGLLTGARMLVITATGDAGYQPGGPHEHLNHLDPHIRTVFGFIGVTNIKFVGVSYDEFPDDRIKSSLIAAQAAVTQYAHDLANIWSQPHGLLETGWQR